MKTASSVLLFIAVSLLACDQPTPLDYATELEAKKTADGIAYTLSIPKNVFALSDSLKLTFRVQNESNAAKEFVFANQQQFAFQLTDASGNIALFYPLIVQPAGSGFSLQPGESTLFSMSLLFKDHNGNFINQGDYRLSASLAEGKSPAVSLQISVQ